MVLTSANPCHMTYSVSYQEKLVNCLAASLDSKRARIESRCCPQVLFRKRRFYSKCLLLGVFASEAARQLTSFSG